MSDIMNFMRKSVLARGAWVFLLYVSTVLGFRAGYGARPRRKRCRVRRAASVLREGDKVLRAVSAFPRERRIDARMRPVKGYLGDDARRRTGLVEATDGIEDGVGRCRST